MVQAPPPPPPPFLPPWEETRQDSANKQGRIEIAVFTTFLAFVIILVLGRLRFRGTTMMKIGSSILAMGADKLITYITGLMGQLSASSDLYVLWVAFLAYLSTLTTNSNCYTLVDNEEQKKSLVVQYTVAWGLIVGTLQASLAAPDIMVPVAFIFWISVLKLRERRRALLAATRSTFGMTKVTKVISDFFLFKEQNSTVKADHPYFVALKDDTHRMRYKTTGNQAKIKKKNRFVPFELKHFITTNDVLAETNKEQGMDFRKTCSSFAMFWLLLARIAGYYNVDMRVDFDKILELKGDQQGKEDNEKKEQEIFGLVEKELEFLYDYLYTNSYAVYARGVCRKIVDIGIIVLFFILALPLIVEYRTQDHNEVYVLVGNLVLDTGFTRFVILAIFVSEFTQFGIFLTSKWGKVIYTCARIRKQSSISTQTNTGKGTRTLMTTIANNMEIWMVKFARLIPRPTFEFVCAGKAQYAKVKLGQYSILKNYNKVPSLLWFSCWIGGYVEMPRWGQDGKKYTEISLELKEAVVSCIKGWGKRDKDSTQGQASPEANSLSSDSEEPKRLTDSLIENGASGEIIEILGNYTRFESQARVILIWHIATSLLEDEVIPPRKDDDKKASLVTRLRQCLCAPFTPEKKDIQVPTSKYFQVATKFSKYCAYLVALNPQMIPGHGGDVHTVECEFDQAVRELKAEYIPPPHTYDIIDEEKHSLVIEKDDEQFDPIFREGVRLRKALFPDTDGTVLDGHSEVWKMLADFWTEMVLFLALRSDHREVMDAHANHLSVGGEFITHLWALLLHKGYQTKIPKKSTTTANKNTSAPAGPSPLSKISGALDTVSDGIEFIGQQFS